jgi:putative transposase
LLGLPRSTFYHQPAGESRENLRLMRRLDELYLEVPYFGSRKFAVVLGREQRQRISRKRVQRLMRLMGIEALYPKPNLSRPAPGHEIYPYLRREVVVSRPNQVWSTDITYIPMRSGFLYLVAIMDWFSRLVLSWDLSNTMGVDFCRSALEEALRAGRCEIFNSDQGSQFTASQFLQPLKDQSIRISMDGRGRAMDNVFIERLWRSVKYELIYPGEFDSGAELWSALSRYFDHYNFRRPHQALGYRTPADLYWNRRPHNKMRRAAARLSSRSQPTASLGSFTKAMHSNEKPSSCPRGLINSRLLRSVPWPRGHNDG